MDPPLAVPELVELTKSERVEDVRYSTRKLGNAAGSAKGRREVVQEGVRAVMTAAQAPDLNVRRHSARTLANLTERGTVNKAYLALGTRYRSWVLAELDAMDARTKQKLEKGGAASLTSLARCQSAKVRRHGSRDLAFLAKDDPHVKGLFHSTGGARALVALGRHPDPAVCLHAVESLLHLAISGRIEEDCKYLDILPALSQLADSDEPRVRRAAVFAMHKIVAMMEAQNSAWAEGDTEVEGAVERERILYKLAKAGVVQALVRLAQSEDVKVRQHAVRGLANFAQSDLARPFILEANGAPVLERCARSVDVEEKRHASRAIAFLHKITV